MKVIEVLNVGQGDSIIVRPTSGCCFSGKTIFVDLGSGKYDITKEVMEDEKIHIFLTHHDNDHLGGLRFFIGKMDQIREIIVPFYQNEITLIARAIVNLKGINSSKDCNEFIKELEEIVNNQVIVKSLLEDDKNHPQLSFAYEGKEFCDHIECLNPPMLVETYNWISETNHGDLIKIMYDIFTKSFASEMESYIRAHGRNRKMDSPDFDHFMLPMQEEFGYEIDRAKCNYVLDYIMKNLASIRQFNSKSSRKNFRIIYDQYIKCTHDACTVLKMNFDGKTILLTGDASKKVFNRLIQSQKDISATYLKMPHHGSKHNMNRKILDKINPEVAIISHENRHFGKAKDPHPNQEILDLLLSKNIKVLITNSVVKNDVTIMEKDNHRKDSFVDIL